MIDLHAEFIGGRMDGRRGPVNPKTQPDVRIVGASSHNASGNVGYVFAVEIYDVEQDDTGHVTCRLLSRNYLRDGIQLPQHLKVPAHKRARGLDDKD